MAGRRIKIRWAETAKSDIENIRQYIAADSVEQSKRVIRLIREEVTLVKRFPCIGEVVPDFGIDAVHELHIFSYRIFYYYQKTAGLVYVLSVFHSSRDLTAKTIKQILISGGIIPKRGAYR